MKIIILLVCCGIALLTFLISLIGYPLIASMLNCSPLNLSLWIGIISFLIILFLTMYFTKRRFLRLCIIISYALSVTLSSTVLFVRFSHREYKIGYLVAKGTLYNRLGFRIISSSDNWFYTGLNRYGENVIITVKERWEANPDDIAGVEKVRDIKVYDTDGNFIDSITYTYRYARKSMEKELEERLNVEFGEIVGWS